MLISRIKILDPCHKSFMSVYAMREHHSNGGITSYCAGYSGQHGKMFSACLAVCYYIEHGGTRTVSNIMAKGGPFQ